MVDVNADSPAYNAGIQCGDIITVMGGESIVTMKDFQVKLEAVSYTHLDVYKRQAQSHLYAGKSQHDDGAVQRMPSGENQS